MHHAAIDDTEDQPHQHGHNVLGECISEAVFRHCHSAPWPRGAGITGQEAQRGRGRGVEHFKHFLITI